MNKLEQLKQQVQNIIEKELSNQRNNVNARVKARAYVLYFLQDKVTNGDIMCINYITCDETNNPDNVVDRGGLIIDISITTDINDIAEFKVGFLDSK